MFEKVKALIADKLSINEDEITMESAFVDDLNADSLDIVELIMALKMNLIWKYQMMKLKSSLLLVM